MIDGQKGVNLKARAESLLTTTGPVLSKVTHLTNQEVPSSKELCELWKLQGTSAHHLNLPPKNVRKAVTTQLENNNKPAQPFPYAVMTDRIFIHRSNPGE